MLFFRRKGSGANRQVAIGLSERGVGMAAVAREGDAPPVLEGCEFVECAPGTGWEEALAELARRHQLSRSPCTIVVEPDAYSLLLLEAPEVPADELKAALRWRVRDLIDFHVDDAVIDVFDVPPHRSGSRASMMYVVVARRPEVGLRTGLAHDVGLELRAVDIPELAQRNVAAALPEDVAGVALLHLSARSGLITLTRQGVLYLARRLDTGLDDVGLDDDGLARWLDVIAVELQRSLDYYESNFAQAPIGHVVVGPLERPIAGLDGHLAERLGVRSRELDIGSLLDCAEPPSREVAARCFGVVGGALREEAPA